MQSKKQYNENGEKHGVWVEYYDDGRISEKITYINGVPNGKYESYYATNEVSYLGFYINGISFGYHIEKWLNRKNEWYYAR